MTADDLLKIKRPEDLFRGDPAEAKRQYHELAKKWHPDHNNGNAQALNVFQHINALYDQASSASRRTS